MSEMNKVHSALYLFSLLIYDGIKKHQQFKFKINHNIFVQEDTNKLPVFLSLSVLLKVHVVLNAKA